MSPVKMTDRNNECNLFELCFLLQQEKKFISKQKLRFNSSKYKKAEMSVYTWLSWRTKVWVIREVLWSSRSQ